MPNAEELVLAKKDLAEVVDAFETRDDSNVSQKARSLVSELAFLDESAWGELLDTLDDGGLRDLLGSIRRHLDSMSVSDAIRKVGHSVSFDVSSRALMVGLHFETPRRDSLSSSQDLEDTLWIGAAVVKVVAETMKAVDGTLSAEVKRGCIGDLFEKNLKQAEDAIGEIRRIYASVCKPDAPDSNT